MWGKKNKLERNMLLADFFLAVLNSRQWCVQAGHSAASWFASDQGPISVPQSLRCLLSYAIPSSQIMQLLSLNVASSSLPDTEASSEFLHSGLEFTAILPLLFYDLSCCLRSFQVWSRSATSARSRNLLEMKILVTLLQPHPTPTESETWNKPSRWFWCTIKLENHRLNHFSVSQSVAIEGKFPL